jgi:putative tributyrin esterase
MNIATLQFRSESLDRQVTYTAILPEPSHGPGPFPVLYQLHGHGGDHAGWVLRTRLITHAAPYPLIVVCPDGGNSGWRNRSSRERYEDFVTRDLAAHVAATFHVRPGRAAIGGLSMGGGGAIRLGLKHPDLYASIWAHSSGISTRERLLADGASEAEADADDLYAVAGHALAAGTELPRLSLDCGVDDTLLERNRDFHRHLERIGLPHGYHEHPGAHTWEYWDTHVVEALRQHAAILNIHQL